MTEDKFCLQWNDFENNISRSFRELREDNNFFDVTLACDDDQIQAHKVVVSACSPFFRTVLKRNPHTHPLLYLKGVKFSVLQSVLDFMYYGKVCVTQEELQPFLTVAEDLQVKGLTQNKEQSSSINNVHPLSNQSISQPPPPVNDSLSQPPSTGFNNIQNMIAPIKPEPKTYQAGPTEQENVLNYEYYRQYEVEEGKYEARMDGEQGNCEARMEGEEGNFEAGMTEFWSADHDEVDGKIEDMIRQCPEGGYLCQVCGHINGKKQNLKKHAEKHIQTPGYPCSFCQNRFKTRNSLNTHVSTRHRDERKKHD